jgi:hypothetical protein
MKNNYYLFLITLIFSVVSLQSFAQTYSVSGYIVDRQGQGIESVYVISENADLQKNALSDANGFFELKLSEGSYMLKGIYFNELLFEKAIDVKADIKFENIETNPALTLDEIVVKGEKSVIKSVEDKLIFGFGNLI